MIFDILKLSIILLAIDSVYLYSISSKFQYMIKNIQGISLKINLFYTFLCYIFLVFLIYYFIIIKKASTLDAFLLGFSVYGIYEATNLAIFKKWEPLIGIVDTLWGGILFSLSYFLFLKIKN